MDIEFGSDTSISNVLTFRVPRIILAVILFCLLFLFSLSSSLLLLYFSSLPQLRSHWHRANSKSPRVTWSMFGKWEWSGKKGKERKREGERDGKVFLLASTVSLAFLSTPLRRLTCWWMQFLILRHPPIDRYLWQEPLGVRDAGVKKFPNHFWHLAPFWLFTGPGSSVTLWQAAVNFRLKFAKFFATRPQKWQLTHPRENASQV